MQRTHASKVGRVVPARRAGQQGRGEAGRLANGGLPHPGALGTARPANTTNTFGARNLRRLCRPRAPFHNNKQNNKRK